MREKEITSKGTYVIGYDPISRESDLCPASMMVYRKEIVSSLDCPGLNLDKRVCGNSTRQINFIVQKLFEGYAVDIKDHYDSNIMHNLLLKRVKNRLESDKLLRNSQKLVHIRDRIYKIEFK